MEKIPNAQDSLSNSRKTAKVGNSLREKITFQCLFNEVKGKSIKPFLRPHRDLRWYFIVPAS